MMMGAKTNRHGRDEMRPGLYHWENTKPARPSSSHIIFRALLYFKGQRRCEARRSTSPQVTEAPEKDLCALLSALNTGILPLPPFPRMAGKAQCEVQSGEGRRPQDELALRAGRILAC